MYSFLMHDSTRQRFTAGTGVWNMAPAMSAVSRCGMGSSGGGSACKAPQKDGKSTDPFGER